MLRVRLERHTFIGLRLRPRQIAQVEPRLGEIEVAAAEIRIRLHRLLEVAHGVAGRRPRSARSLARLKWARYSFRVSRQLGFVLGDRRGGLAARLVDEPEIVVRHRFVRLCLQRSREGSAPRRRTVSARCSTHRAWSGTRAARPRRRQRVPERCFGFREFTALHPDVGELPRRFRVAGVQGEHSLKPASASSSRPAALKASARLNAVP